MGCLQFPYQIDLLRIDEIQIAMDYRPGAGGKDAMDNDPERRMKGRGVSGHFDKFRYGRIAGGGLGSSVGMLLKITCGLVGPGTPACGCLHTVGRRSGVRSFAGTWASQLLSDVKLYTCTLQYMLTC